MHIGVRVLSEMSAKGWSEGELARRAGVTQPTVHRIITGESKSPKRDNVEKIARALGVPSKWLWDGGPKPSPEPFDNNVDSAFRPFKKATTYPVISWIAAGARAQSPEHYVPGPGLAFESDQNAGEYGYWLEVKGGSMTSNTSPTFLPGTYVLVQPEGFDLVSGKYYIAQHRDGETTFKQYVYDAGREYLVPLNPAFETIKMDDDWDVIGRVIDVKITGL